MRSDVIGMEKIYTRFESPKDDHCAQWTHGNYFSLPNYLAFCVALATGIVASAGSPRYQPEISQNAWILQFAATTNMDIINVYLA